MASTSPRRNFCCRSEGASAIKLDVSRLAELAERLGAMLSASRPVIDAGWIDRSRGVGQSGKTVRPSVYLALGISGAGQHLAGIRGAGTIIAVNKDPAAPIFSIADYGAVADLFEVAAALEQVGKEEQPRAEGRP